jgi:hypothetical protein
MFKADIMVNCATWARRNTDICDLHLRYTNTNEIWECSIICDWAAAWPPQTCNFHSCQLGVEDGERKWGCARYLIFFWHACFFSHRRPSSSHHVLRWGMKLPSFCKGIPKPPNAAFKFSPSRPGFCHLVPLSHKGS